MLHGAGPGPDRPLRALGAVGVDGDEPAVVRRLLDRGPDLVLGQLGRAGHAAPREHRAGADALDDVGAADQQPPHALADLGRRGDDAEPEVLGQPDVVRQADDVAAAPGRGDERAGALHPRALELAAR